MSNVEKGGNTIFKKLGLSVAPEGGGALFWYNLNHNGLEDDRMIHAACPVVKGTKWAVNKWIRYRGQFLHRPCMLHENDLFTRKSFNLSKKIQQK